MKRLFVLLLVASILISPLGNTTVFADTKTSSAKGTEETWPKGPKVNAESAILMDVSSGLILYEKNSHKKQYPASITKIMTTLLAIENCSMGEIVTFSHDCVFGIETGSSHIGIDVDEKLTVEQALYAIMLASANEVSWGIGEHVSGSLKAFAKAMNTRAKELGCTDTHFVNANGLHNDNHYTTVYDMALISREAMKSSTFRKIISTKSYTIPPTNKHKEPNSFLNHHQMLVGNKYPQYKYEYCIGGKTGYTTKAGSTLVTFAKKDDVELLCVVMRANGPASSENEYTDTTSLFNWGFENFTQHDITGNTDLSSDTESPLFTKYNPIFDQTNSPLRLGTNTTILLPNGVDFEKAERKVNIYKNISLKDGENIVGNVSYNYGGKTVGSTDIIFDKTKAVTLTSLTKTRQINAKTVKGANTFNLKPIIITVIILFIIGCICLYISILRKRKKNSRSYRF
ncbi:D-alanyl-D-alanine carboxypeptidase family protein [Velocimicrobium porci]|uniref:D-alanyl-D-alanine carboxypeptidase n=1 Tax=Velocimicrobium porci TaxID=2606634 RepID=A0A6L5XW33_9FIRM|nr:D-alanyl-D-alanine carboxypeptidase family protein [Velocimicrobium porci]MSS62942.1 D-alanyl-D-alanine carboxypeptidase [Velocimicrobium porci]